MVSYSDETNGDLRLAVYDGWSWESTAVDLEGEVGTHNSLTLLEFDRPAISYYDATNGDLKFAVSGDWPGLPPPVVWTVTTVESAGDTGRDTWLSVVYGQPAISYRGADGTLQYTRFDGASWQNALIDADSDAGWTTCLNILPLGRPTISHWHVGVGLGFSWHDGTSWHTAHVDRKSVV